MISFDMFSTIFMRSVDIFVQIFSSFKNLLAFIVLSIFAGYFIYNHRHSVGKR